MFGAFRFFFWVVKRFSIFKYFSLSVGGFFVFWPFSLFRIFLKVDEICWILYYISFCKPTASSTIRSVTVLQINYFFMQRHQSDSSWLIESGSCNSEIERLFKHNHMINWFIYQLTLLLYLLLFDFHSNTHLILSQCSTAHSCSVSISASRNYPDPDNGI